MLRKAWRKLSKTEYDKGESGRWGAGLPGSGDMQMLFLQSAVDKMDDNFGRCAIIENGSPLFSGGTASGESQIRRWLLENDLIEQLLQCRLISSTTLGLPLIYGCYQK